MKNNNDLEIYATIKDFPNYLVTSHGRVISLNDNYGNYRMKELKQFKSKKGYMYVDLYKNNKKFHKYVHRLVAITFIPNHENKPEVNHNDENKTNNHISNLEWMTRKENNNYGTHNERVRKTKCDGRLK